jgi:S1-C subfamily serine protease
MRRKAYILLGIIVTALAIITVTRAQSSLSQIHGTILPSQTPQARIGAKGVMGYVITGVNPGSPAEQAGLKPGDIITSLNDEQVISIEQVQNTLTTNPPGTSFEIKYKRFNPATGNLDEHTVTVKSVPLASISSM